MRKSMKRNVMLLGLTCAAALAMISCDTVKVSDDDVVVIKTYRELRKKMEDKDNQPVVLVDPRPAKRYNVAHVDGAINIPINQMVENDPKLADAKTIIIVSAGWSDYLGTAGAKRLMAQKYSNVFEFHGGVEQWKADGGRVIVATQPATQSSTQPSTIPAPRGYGY